MAVLDVWRHREKDDFLDMSCYGRSVDDKICSVNFNLSKDIKDSTLFSKKGFVLLSF